MRVLALIILFLIMLPLTVAAQSADDRYPFVRDSKVGFIDYQGREVIPPRFSSAGDWAHFDHGLAPVFEAGKGSGYIDPSGKFVIGPTQVWGWGRPFHEDIAGVLIWDQKGNYPGWIDRTGKVVFSHQGVEGSFFADGLMPMPGPEGKWGFVGKDFKFVIEPQFGRVTDFYEGRAEFTVKDKSGFIDTSGKIVVPAKYDMVWPFHDGVARVRRDIENGTYMTMEGRQPNYRYQYGFIDHDGNEIIALQFEEATYFSEGYAMAVPSNFKRYGIIDKLGHFVHQPEFESAGEFHDGLAMACVKQKCGFVDTNGAWIIPPQFESVRDFWHGLASVSWKDGDYGYVNKTGKIVWRSSTSPKPAL